MTRMLSRSSARCCTTQSTAATIWETSTPPSLVATLTLMSRAPGAMPRKRRGRAGQRVVARDDAGHVRAVPVGVEVAEVVGLALEGQVRPVDDVAGRQPWTPTTPVSISATSTPRPVTAGLVGARRGPHLLGAVRFSEVNRGRGRSWPPHTARWP